MPLDVVQCVTDNLDILREVVEAGIELEDEDEALKPALKTWNTK